MENENQNSLPARIEFESEGQKIVFHSLADFESWMQQEIGFWSWLNTIPVNDINPHILYKHFNGVLREISNRIASVKNYSSEQLDQLNELNQYLNEVYQKRMVVAHVTPLAQFIDSLRKEDPSVAYYALAYLLGKDCREIQPRQSSPDFFQVSKGLFEAIAFQKGITLDEVRIESERASFQEIHDFWYEKFSKYSNQIISLSEKYDKIAGNIEELNSKQTSAFDEAMTKNKERLENIEKTYHEKMALQSPVQYWENKASSHYKMSWIFGFISLFTMIGVVILLSIEMEKLFKAISGSTNKPEYWQLLFFAIIATFGIWLTRLIVRVFLSNLHLHTDAKERVTMVKTYLALHLEGKGGLNENDRQLILQSLFRPTSTGIIKDEGIPPSAFDYISKICSGKM